MYPRLQCDVYQFPCVLQTLGSVSRPGTISREVIFHYKGPNAQRGSGSASSAAASSVDITPMPAANTVAI